MRIYIGPDEHTWAARRGILPAAYIPVILLLPANYFGSRAVKAWARAVEHLQTLQACQVAIIATVAAGATVAPQRH